MGLVKGGGGGDEPVEGDRRRRLRGPGGLLDQLSDSRVLVRRWAVRDLSAFPESAKHLLAHLSHESDESVREVIFTALAAIGTEEVVTGLIPLLKSEDASLRNGAVEVLQSLPDPVGRHVDELLNDPDSDTRIFAVDILREIAHPHLVDWLCDILGRDDHVNVCAAAVDGLSEVGSAHTCPNLRRLKERFPEEPFIAFAVDNALSRIDPNGQDDSPADEGEPGQA